MTSVGAMLDALDMAKTEKTGDTPRGARIAAAREALGLTQDELRQQIEAHLGKSLTAGAVGNWEQGKGIKSENAGALAHILRTSIVGLADGRVLVKKVMRSKTPGSHVLASNTHAEPPFEGIIEWAARVKGMMPR